MHTRGKKCNCSYRYPPYMTAVGKGMGFVMRSVLTLIVSNIQNNIS